MNHRYYLPLILLLLLFSLSSAQAAEGFFTVGQQDGRWWFFDPAGEKFFSTGVNVLSPGGHYCPDLGYSPYHENIMNLYGSEEAWADVTAQRMEEWNFNTLGGWSSIGLLGDEMPQTSVLYMSGADWLSGFVPDYWGEEFYERVDDIAADLADNVNNPMVLGYFLDNEMRWGPDWRRFADLFADYMQLGPDDPGKTVLVEWLRARHGGNLVDINMVYGLHVRSWEELYKPQAVAKLPRNSVEAVEREAWTGVVAEQFFSVASAAVRAVDPNHLILGSRFVSWCTPLVVLEAAAPYVDVISVNHYLLWEPFAWLHQWLIGRDAFHWLSTQDMLTQYNELTGKPILISEFSMRGLDAVPPSTFPPNYFFKTAADQDQRVEWVMNYTDQCVKSEYCIGYHWFDYMDEPELGRFDGENSNFGLVDEQDAPYELLVDAFTEKNIEVYSWPFN